MAESIFKRRRWVLTFLFTLVTLMTAGLVGAQWKGKEFTLWTAKDVDEMLSDSPWARGVVIAVGLPKASDDGSGDAAPARGGRRTGAGAITFDPAGPAMNLIFYWRSALPVKQALVKKRNGASLVIPPDMQTFLTQSEESYVIGVSGIQARFARALQAPGALDGSMIRRGKKEPIRPVDLQLQQAANNTIEVLYFFPRTVPITAEDKEIEVVIKIGQFEATRKFNLKDMVFNGKLEL